MTIPLIKEFEEKFKSKNTINFKVGDTVRVYSKIIEGEKERVQMFTGIVVAIKGKGLSQTFTVYRSAYGCNMERVFLINSPRLTKVQIERHGKVKRSKLYYLRGESGKKVKVKERLFKKEKKAAVTTQEEVKEPQVKEESKAEEKPPVEEKKAKKENKKEAKKTEKEEKKPKAKKEEKAPKKEKKEKPDEEK
ncbi:MAG: 50S ribosomal protein L19 [Candidatus Anoxychlamydiales bacterium]|nr:50S ribosomal protein L19 [Candidatus Anoxychlamydiales bacterium]